MNGNEDEQEQLYSVSQNPKEKKRSMKSSDSNFKTERENHLFMYCLIELYLLSQTI